MNYTDICISEPFAKAIMTSHDVYPWPLTVPGVPQTVINNPVNMSSASQCCHPVISGGFDNFPVAISDKPEELRPQNGIVVYYTGVPAFATWSSQPISNEVEKPCSGTDGEKTQWKKEKMFPWINNFSKQCCAAVGNKSVKQLENLLNSYIQHVTPHYNECQKLPNKAFKLKRNINETMVFLHLLYSDLHEPLENGFYHEKMAEVMAMYLDLEITAFRRGKDTVKEVYNRLSSTLYTFLDHSDDYILDALLRTQLVNKYSKNLCSPFLRKILTELVVCRPLSALTYVRYVLAFKLWKNVVAEANEKKTINKIALQRLHPPPKFFQDHDIAKPSAEILPKVPKNKKNCSQFYIQAKFNLKDACRAFFRFCKETNCQEEPVYLANFSEKTEEVENNGCLSLINEIWSTMSNDTSDDMPLLGKSEVFSEDRMFCDDTSLCESEEVFIKADVSTKSCQKVESPDSGVCLDGKEKSKRKISNDGELDKVPDSTYVIYPDSQELKSGGDESTDVDGSVAETISETASPEPSSTVPGVSNELNGESSTQRAAEPGGPFRQHLPDQKCKAASSIVTSAPVAKTRQESLNQSPSSSVICHQDATEIEKPKGCVEVKIKGERAEDVVEVELPSSSQLLQMECQAPYPISPSAGNVSLPELRSSETLTYREVLRSGDLAKLEWRRYSDLVALSGSCKTKLDVSVDEQAIADDADSRNHHSSSNCHLPLKKRKLAASSSDSPTMDSKQGYSSPFSDSDYQTKVLELAIREEKRVLEEDTYKFAHWDTMPASRERELQRLRFQNNVDYENRWRPDAMPSQKRTPADLSTTSMNSPLRSCLEGDFSQRRRSYEVFSARECHPPSPQTLVGVSKIDNTEVPDNLTILAEEAARIWEERAQGSGVQTPFEMLTSQTNAVNMKADYIPQGRMMMSIAEALESSNQKKLEESVIVRNDQYQYYKEQSKSSGRVHANAQYHAGSNKGLIPEMSYEESQRKGERNHRVNGEKPQDFSRNAPTTKRVVVNGGDCREHNPIDMSGKRRDCVELSYSLSEKDGKPLVVEKSSICSNCKSSVCKGKCKITLSNAVQGTLSRQQATPVRVSCSNCKSQACNGKKCKVVLQSREASVHLAEASKKSYPNSNNEQKNYKKCSYCKNTACYGMCKNASKIHPSSDSKVLKCALCKFAHCNGSCTTSIPNVNRSTVCQYCRKSGCDSSQCLFASPQSKKCDGCKSHSCNGKCKANQNSTHKKPQNQEPHTYPPTKIAKCSYCKSTCFGTCRLAEKNQQRCNRCNTIGCKGKCSGTACNYCSQKNCNGACRIHHSVDNILGSTSKAASSAPNRRRTRNSQSIQQTKPRTPLREEKSTPESKRRKKSISR